MCKFAQEKCRKSVYMNLKSLVKAWSGKVSTDNFGVNLLRKVYAYKVWVKLAQEKCALTLWC